MDWSLTMQRGTDIIYSAANNKNCDDATAKRNSQLIHVVYVYIMRVNARKENDIIVRSTTNCIYMLHVRNYCGGAASST